VRRGCFVRCSVSPEVSVPPRIPPRHWLITQRLFASPTSIEGYACGLAKGVHCMNKMLLLCGLVALISVPSFAAPQFLYANDATFGTPYIYQIDPATGNVLQTITNLQGTNGRGVVNVNNILYYTDADSGDVFKYNLATHTPLGVAFTVAGASGLASITYDGTNFWIGDYSGSNHAFLYSPTGTLLNTITLSLCTSFCDGLTFFKQGGVGFLMSNRVDGCCNGTPVQYDVYSTSGSVVTADLITNPLPSTGVAWDGTHFFTSNINNGSISEWTMSGTFVQTLPVTGGSMSPLIEGMSFNFAQTVGTPEPGTLVMFGTGIVGLAGLLRRKFLA